MLNCPNSFTLLIISLLSILIFIIPQSEHKKDKEKDTEKGIKKWLLSKNPEDIKFYLFPDPDDEDYNEEIILGNEHSLKHSQFDPGKPVIILIHGLLGNPYILTDVQLIKNAYLSVRYSANIIMVDYGKLSGTHFPYWLSIFNGLFSFPAYKNVEIISDKITEFIYYLKDMGGISSPKNIHLVGYSMGCIIAGKVGNIIGNSNGMKNKIKRITGLDCPFNIKKYKKIFLHKTNAFFIDITHTVTTKKYKLSFEILERFGHVDFYINGIDFVQPNCPNIFPFTDPYCSHTSSVFYFAKSIRNKNIFGCYCETCISKPMECAERNRYGQYISTKVRGSFYVDIPQQSRDF